MHINRDDIEDVTELTNDITSYVFEKLEDQDEHIYKSVILGMFSTILVNKFKPYDAYKFIECVIKVLDKLENDCDEEEGEENG